MLPLLPPLPRRCTRDVGMCSKTIASVPAPLSYSPTTRLCAVACVESSYVYTGGWLGGEEEDLCVVEKHVQI